MKLKKVMVTGISGTLGQAVSKILLQDPYIEIIGFSRDEQKQSMISPHKRLTLVLGDVRDSRRVTEASRDCDMILHFAALKMVDTLEHNPEESIATNILGTENVLGAQRTNKIKRVVLSSTDKAVYPINVYGNCKALAEKLVLRNSNNVVVRYGNVLASRGSVIPMFIKSLKDDGTVRVTDTEMTRFFLRIDDAAKYVIHHAFGKEGGLKINPMKSVKIVDLAKAVAEIIGVQHPKMIITGIRPGEKIHEDLIAKHEGDFLNSLTADKFSKEELIELLTPVVKSVNTHIRVQVIRRRPEVTA